jgi:hypothetical protein
MSSLTPRTIVRSGCLAGALENAGRLDHDLDAHVRPGQIRRVALRERLDEIAVDHQAILTDFNRAVEAAIV